MSKQINGDDPAFPKADGTYGGSQNGMCLRDYLAGQALLGIYVDWRTALNYGAIATAAYRIADAMLKARNEFDPPQAL